MAKKRLQFCQKYRQWTKEDWKKVLFSDESSFQLFSTKKLFVRRPIGSSPLNSRYTTASLKHHGSIMVWGRFSYSGRGTMTFLEKGAKRNTDQYLSILEEKLTTFLSMYDFPAGLRTMSCIKESQAMVSEQEYCSIGLTRQQS